MPRMEWNNSKLKWTKGCPTCNRDFEVEGETWDDAIVNMLTFFCYHNNHTFDKLYNNCRECANDKWSNRTGDKTKLELFTEQDGKCAICEIEVTFGKVKVDHDYKTNKTRALLCHKCNTAMAPIDNDEWLNKAIKYRDKYREKHDNEDKS